MEGIANDVEGGHYGVLDLDALVIDAGVERTVDFQAGFGGGRANQLDDSDTIGQRPAAPVLGDVAEETMLILAPPPTPERLVASWLILRRTLPPTCHLGLAPS
jgi:hypothetical protein